MGPEEMDLGLRSSDLTQCLDDSDKRSIESESGVDCEKVIFPRKVKNRGQNIVQRKVVLTM